MDSLYKLLAIYAEETAYLEKGCCSQLRSFRITVCQLTDKLMLMIRGIGLSQNKLVVVVFFAAVIPQPVANYNSRVLAYAGFHYGVQLFAVRY